MENPGDLGRRVSERRTALGLSREALAERAGVDPVYLRHVETSPSSALSASTLRRLAIALETSVESLTGGGTQLPAGQGHPEDATLAIIDVSTCRHLIEPGGVGRVVYSAERGPVAVPVNYEVLDDDVVFRTEITVSMMPDLLKGRVSFEVDSLDDPLEEAWSVLLSGVARAVTDPAELSEVQSLAIEPWAGGERDAYIRLSADVITGRRIRRTTR
ncbi:MAG: helix-turn-helix domain-containing protein [Acidimicrobiales bacterium]